MYTSDDLKTIDYATLQKGEEVRVRIDQVELTKNQYKPDRKDLKLVTTVTSGSQEGKPLNATLFDGSQMYSVVKGLFSTEQEVLNFLNHNEGTSKLIGRSLLVTAKEPKVDDKGRSFTQLAKYEILG